MKSWFITLIGLTPPLAGGALGADFPPLRPAVRWLERERLRGTLFHQPNVEPLRPLLVTPALPEAPPAEAVPVTLRGWHYLILLPEEDGRIAFRLRALEGRDPFPHSLYAVFDPAGEEIAAGQVPLGEERLIEESAQAAGPHLVRLNSGPASSNTVEVTVLNRYGSLDGRPRGRYGRSPLHYHFLRDLKLGGFNLAMIDVEGLAQSFATEEGLAQWTAQVKRWADYARKVQLRLMPAIDLGGTEYEVEAWGDAPKGLYIEEKAGQPLAPCPLQEVYWERILLRRGREVAKLSLENPFLVGLGIDPEMYQCWSYGHYMLSGTCFCDHCLGGFLKKLPAPAGGAEGRSLLTEKKTGKERHQWLVDQGLMAQYDHYLEEEMSRIAAWCREELHRINPDFLLCVGVLEIGNWFCRGLARGLGEEGLPVLNFCEHTYYSVGYDRPWLERTIQGFRDWGAQVIQGSALWDMHFPPTRPSFLAAHAYNLAVNAQGWWYWPGDRLHEDWTCTHAYLNQPAYFEDYWAAATWANGEIEQTMRQPGRSSPLEAAETVPWRGKYSGEKGWQTEPEVLRSHQEPSCPVHVAAPIRLYFSVPERAPEFEVVGLARGIENAARLLVRDPEGQIAGEAQVRGTGPLAEPQKIALNGARPGLWSLEVQALPGTPLRDIGLAVSLPVLLSPTPQMLLVPPLKKPGLIGYWPLDEGQGTKVADASQPPAFDGSLRGGHWVPGKVGSALAFDGRSGGVTIPVEPPFHHLPCFTLSAWVRLDALPQPGNGASLVNKGPEAPVQHFWWWIGYPPDYRLILELGSEKHRWGAAFTSQPLTWELGRWYHVAAVCESDGQRTTVRHYRDGEIVGTETREEAFHSGTSDLQLGTYGGLHWLNGALDEVKIWDRALSPEEVRAQ
jgi:hypothetical protein